MSVFQQPFPSSKIRSSGGCWTCRSRRKKCNENHPVCDTCKALNITCYFQEEKPEWMDGGPKQREMADRIKAEVRKQASQRRERKHLGMLGADTNMVSIGDFKYPAMSGEGRTGTPPVSPDTNPCPRSESVETLPESSNINDMSRLGSSLPNREITGQDHPNEAPNRERHLLMIYLDFVFPYLFPHYRPPLLAGGRGWILDTLYTNKSVYHSAVSLSSFFYAIALANGDEAHEECTAQIAQKFSSQLELGLQELQKEMSIISASQSGLDKNKWLVVMHGIIQMLFFEVATSDDDKWRLHLDGAIGAFLQFFSDPEEWTKMLKDMYSPTKWPPLEFGSRRPWSTNQAALRFFTASVLYIDVISSVTLRTAPRLAHYHQDIMPSCSLYNRSHEPLMAGPLSVDEFFGLPNWIVQVLGDVAALASWKQTQKQTSSLSMIELVSRGQVLSEVIKGGLQMLEDHPGPQRRTKYPFSLLEADTSRSRYADLQPHYEIIWLLATLSYLNVVISGWQPSSPEIRWSVLKATELFSQLPEESDLRTLAWPMCISGCLSLPQDEGVYRTLAHRLKALPVFGRETMEIMERVWSMRGQTDEDWDIAKCLNILGHGVLLI